MTQNWPNLCSLEKHNLEYWKNILRKIPDFFFLSWFSSGTVKIHRTAGGRRDHLLFHSTTSNRSQTLRHLFATLHVRWRSSVFNHNACIYQAATRWDLPSYFFTKRTSTEKIFRADCFINSQSCMTIIIIAMITFYDD